MRRRFDRAGQLLERAAGTGSARQARALVRRAVEILGESVRITRRLERGGALGGDCGRVLRAFLIDARRRAVQWLRAA